VCSDRVGTVPLPSNGTTDASPMTITAPGAEAMECGSTVRKEEALGMQGAEHGPGFDSVSIESAVLVGEWTPRETTCRRFPLRFPTR
jgi:hypothetical protein